MSLIICATSTRAYSSIGEYYSMAHERPMPWSSEEKISDRILQNYGFFFDLPITTKDFEDVWDPIRCRWTRYKDEILICETCFHGINRRIEIWE